MSNPNGNPGNQGNTTEGEDRPNAVLDESDVRNARWMYDREIEWSYFDNELDRMLVVDLARRGRWTYKALAWYFGVSYGTIAKAVTGVTWKHVH